MDDLDRAVLTWTVVIPQKDLYLAKSRMALGDADRRDVVLAMFDDTLASVKAARLVSRVIVVCDNAADAITLGRDGVITQVNVSGGGLNTSIMAGVTLARDLTPRTAIAVLPADLPGLKPGELDRALIIASRHARSFIRDASGSGTTLLSALPDQELQPSYGPSSRARHALSGAQEIGDGNDLESLRDDVDDLESLHRIIATEGAGARTSRIFAAITAELRHPYGVSL